MFIVTEYVNYECV